MQRKTIFLAAAIAILVFVTIGGTGYMIWKAARHAVDTITLKPVEKQIDLGIVITQVRELNRLETASMHVLHIGRVTQTYEMVPSSLAGDEITFLAAGDVIAGIDLSQLKREDVWRSPDGTI